MTATIAHWIPTMLGALYVLGPAMLLFLVTLAPEQRIVTERTAAEYHAQAAFFARLSALYFRQALAYANDAARGSVYFRAYLEADDLCNEALTLYRLARPCKLGFRVSG